MLNAVYGCTYCKKLSTKENSKEDCPARPGGGHIWKLVQDYSMVGL